MTYIVLNLVEYKRNNMEITWKHIDDQNEGRFIVEADGEEAGFIKYKYLENGNINANGTLVHEKFRDQKLGGPLFDKLIGFAEEKNTKIFPTCPFVVKTFKRKPELAHLLASDYTAE